MPSLPDNHGHFGEFGGKYVAETLMPALMELEIAYKEARRDPAVQTRTGLIARASSSDVPRRCILRRI